MHEGTTTTASTINSGNAATNASAAATGYADNPRRRTPWYKRLKRQRFTSRRIELYVLVAVVIALATPFAPTFVAGSVLVAIGHMLRIWTFGHLEKNQNMTTTGPYAYTRNPAYLGSFIIVCGFVLAAGSPFSATGLVVWALGVIMLIVFFRSYLPRKYAREYPRLEEIFPKAFKIHAANVPDFFPRLTPWRSGDTRVFSWTRVQANHELWWPVLLGLGLAFIWFV